MGDKIPLSIPTAIESAARILAEDKEKYEAAAAERKAAAAREIKYLNELNNAQKEFDKLVSLVKKDSPSDSDWGRNGKG